MYSQLRKLIFYFLYVPTVWGWHFGTVMFDCYIHCLLPPGATSFPPASKAHNALFNYFSARTLKGSSALTHVKRTYFPILWLLWVKLPLRSFCVDVTLTSGRCEQAFISLLEFSSVNDTQNEDATNETVLYYTVTRQV